MRNRHHMYSHLQRIGKYDVHWHIQNHNQCVDKQVDGHVDNLHNQWVVDERMNDQTVASLDQPGYKLVLLLIIECAVRVANVLLLLNKHNERDVMHIDGWMLGDADDCFDDDGNLADDDGRMLDAVDYRLGADNLMDDGGNSSG